MISGIDYRTPEEGTQGPGVPSRSVRPQASESLCGDWEPKRLFIN
jgi:hypothetical protein